MPFDGIVTNNSVKFNISKINLNVRDKLFDIGREYTRKSNGAIVRIVNYINFEPQLQCWKIQVEEDSLENPIILSERDIVGFEQAYNFNPPSRLPSNETKNLHKQVE